MKSKKTANNAVISNNTQRTCTDPLACVEMKERPGILVFDLFDLTYLTCLRKISAT